MNHEGHEFFVVGIGSNGGCDSKQNHYFVLFVFFVVHLLSASAAAPPARAPDAHAEPKWRAAGRLRTDDVLDALVVVKERPAARGAEAAARAARGHRHVARSGGRLVEEPDVAAAQPVAAA